jgi:hypothetical protein
MMTMLMMIMRMLMMAMVMVMMKLETLRAVTWDPLGCDLGRVGCDLGPNPPPEALPQATLSWVFLLPA